MRKPFPYLYQSFITCPLSHNGGDIEEGLRTMFGEGECAAIIQKCFEALEIRPAEPGETICGWNSIPLFTLR